MYKNSNNLKDNYKLLVWILLFFSGNNLLNAQTTNFKIGSPAFVDQGNYPKLFTCDSLAYSPPLFFENTPKTAQMLAVTMSHIARDGDQHVYWVVYNIPTNTSEIPQNSKDIGLIGHNSMNKNLAYAPPCSKGPGVKNYILTAYAVSEKITEEGLTMNKLLKKIKNKIVETSSLTVKYAR